MSHPLVYLATRSLWNGAKVRIGRLRNPKYLFGALVGSLYLFFNVYRLQISAAHPAVWSRGGPPGDFFQVQFAAILLLAAVLLLAWVLPGARATLQFSETEIAWLFPAPFSRPTLVRYKLLSAQLGLLFTSVIFTALRGGWHAGNVWLRIFAWWLVLVNFSVHRLGASFVLQRFWEQGYSTLWRRLGLLAGIALAGGLLLLCGRHASTTLVAAAAAGNLSQVLSDPQIWREAINTGPAVWVLMPFRWVVAPFFAPTPGSFFLATGPALLVLALQYYWVVSADISFEEASIALAGKRAALLEARRRGEARPPRDPLFRLPAFVLRPTGLPLVAFYWKSLLQIGGRRTVKIWTIALPAALLVHHWFGSQKQWQPLLTHSQGPTTPAVIALVILQILNIAAPGLAAFMTFFLVPAAAAGKLRRCLEMIDLLLTFPVRGWQIVLGELAAPILLGTAVQWTAVAAFAWTPLTFVGGVAEDSLFANPLVLLAGALIFPGLNLINAVLSSAAPLLLPAWFKSSSASFEAMGMRLILLLFGLLAFAIALLPPAAAFAGAWFLFRGMESTISTAGGLLAASVILLLEGFCGMYLLGLAFEGFDVTEETA